ncbi:MAG: YbjN domain-containing protein [Actinomycetota bacterium]|nr:YbjN domain-containing protein [Actinomycetota bacterium]
MRPDVTYVYVRDLLERLTGERPDPDGDGDLPVQFGGAQFFVRVVGVVDPWVQVFSVAVADLEPTPGLMVRLNEINAELKFARAFHVSGQVLIETEIWSDDVNPANFHHACSNVAWATDAYATGILSAFGGRPQFEESKTEDYQQGTLPMGVAAEPYL